MYKVQKKPSSCSQLLSEMLKPGTPNLSTASCPWLVSCHRLRGRSTLGLEQGLLQPQLRNCCSRHTSQLRGTRSACTPQSRFCRHAASCRFAAFLPKVFSRKGGDHPPYPRPVPSLPPLLEARLKTGEERRLGPGRGDGMERVGVWARASEI